MRHELNLATRPFLNPRPVARVTVALWLLGILVAGFNVRLYLSHYSGSGANRAREQELQATLRRERNEVQELRGQLETYDVDWQNQQAEFLNAKITQRSFSWSVLFDRLGEVMPADVRLNSLSPSFGGEGRGGRGARGETLEGEVLLGIRGQAKSSDVLLEFIDALFAHDSFRVPNLSSETLKDSGLLDFSLSVIYRRESMAVPAVEEEIGEPADEVGAVQAVDGEESPETTEPEDSAEPEATGDDEGDTAPPLEAEAVTP